MAKIELKRSVYGFRDPEVLGPANFVTIEDKLMVIVYDEQGFVAELMECDVRCGDVASARRRLSTVLRARQGYGIPKDVAVRAVYAGARYR